MRPAFPRGVACQRQTKGGREMGMERVRGHLGARVSPVKQSDSYWTTWSEPFRYGCALRVSGAGRVACVESVYLGLLGGQDGDLHHVGLSYPRGGLPQDLQQARTLHGEKSRRSAPPGPERVTCRG
jgi:hypothetical protein